MAAAVGPWLGRLPLEVRELIYQQVLVEKIEHRMKSAEVCHRIPHVHSINADTINHSMINTGTKSWPVLITHGATTPPSSEQTPPSTAKP